MKTKLALSLATLALSVMVSIAVANADDAQTLDQIDQQLAKLKIYDFDQDGGPVRDLEQTLFQLAADSPLRESVEQKLVAALDDASEVGRGVICRQLRVVGTDRCVPAVAAMLGDPKLSPFARYTLEGIGSKAALDAMLDSLDQVSGSLQVGLLNSLSQRNHQPMRPSCVGLLNSQDPQVVAASIRALGRLGGTESVAVLTAHRDSAANAQLGEIDLALVDCAQQLLEDGADAAAAAAVFSNLYQRPGPFRLAGLRGLVAAQPERAAELLVDAMRQDNQQLASSAANWVIQVPGPEATGRFVAVLDELPAERQQLLIQALGARGDATAAPAIAAAVADSNPAIRRAAVEALGGLSGSAAVDALLAAASDDDAALGQIARSGLTRIKDAEFHLTAIAQTAGHRDAVEAIDALAARKADASTGLMFKLAQADETPKRIAAIRAIGLLAGSQDLEQLVKLALRSEDNADLTEIESSLGRVLTRVESPQARARAVLDALPEATSVTKPMFVRRLAQAGTEDALIAVRNALANSDAKISAAAVQALADWPNAAAANDLMTLIESAKTAELQQQALEGYIRIASQSDDPSAMFTAVLKRVNGVDHQKRVLNEIGLNCESFDAIETTQSLFNDPQLKAVAAIATVRIAYKLRLQHHEQVREILHQVLAKVDHPDVQKRAQDVLNDLDKYQDYILQWVGIGPFVDPNLVDGAASYQAVFEPEQTDTSDLSWKPISLGIGSWDINLEATFGAIDHSSAFVRTMIWSPIDQDILVEGGIDDAMKIWLNGELIHQQWRTGVCEPRTVQAAASLQKGWNELKLKITDHEGGWQFGCRVRNPSGAKVDGLKYEAR